MAKKRSCRRTADEDKIHEKAVKMRKTTMVKEMFHSVSMNPKREAFFVDLNLLDAEVCFHKYFPVTLRHRLEKQARLWTARLGLYKYIKKIFKAINGNREIKR